MGDNKVETAKKQPQQLQHSQQQQLSSPSKDPLEESKEARAQHHHQQPPPPPPPPSPIVASGAPFISAPVFVPIGVTSSPYEPQFEPVNPKRARYSSSQWKPLPSPSQPQQQQIQTQMASIATSESSPSPTTNPISTANPQTQQPHITTASSSEATSSPSNSPVPSLSASGQETTKPGGEQSHHQFRKGKYVSPVWKPNEMLWLARAWKMQYRGGSDGSGSSSSRADHPETTQITGGESTMVQSTRGRTRADKDREVSEFLSRHGVNRDAKTAGTKWDNMLGEFRKVYEWERGGEREQVGKSYFRLSPYERKMHRLPASFDEEVFEELSQFMGPRMRTSLGRGVPSGIGSGEDNRTHTGARAIPPPPSFKEDDLLIPARTKQLTVTSGGEGYLAGTRGNVLGFESSMDVAAGAASSSKELRRIGKIRMTWEESVSLWAEEGEQLRGRVKLQGSSFLNADELTFFDESTVACTMEAFEDGPLKGFSVDRFISGQQVKVFGRRNSFSSAPPASSSAGYIERFQLPLTEPPPTRSMPSWEFQDPTDYYLGCLRVPPATLPSLFELSWYLQEPPPEDLRFPLRKDVYRDLPQGKELFFTTSTELLDSRGITFDILSPIIRNDPSISSSSASSRDSFIGLWDDCLNRVLSKFCSTELDIVRKPSSFLPVVDMQDQWPNVTGFVRSFCLWRGEESDQLREGHIDPSSSIVEKLSWTYMDLPYILGYYAVGYLVTFCALCRSQDRIIRTDLYSLDLSSPSERVKALVPCYRVAGLLPLLADRCFNNNGGPSKELTFSDFERIDMGGGNVMEMTPNTVIRYFSSRRKCAAVKGVYDILDQRIPHAEFVYQSSEKDLALVFKPRGVKSKPATWEQLVEALKYVTKALVALHDLCYMHRDLSWDKVMRRSDRENEWFITGFDEAANAPQLYPHVVVDARGRYAPEMGRGMHGVKVDVWGVGQLLKTCGLGPYGVPKMLRELQNRCLDPNPEQRPTIADCYNQLLQVQSSLHQQQPSSSGGGTYS